MFFNFYVKIHIYQKTCDYKTSFFLTINDIMPFAKLSYNFYSKEKSTTLPQLLQTPSGLILIEIQGTLHIGNQTLVSSGGFGLNNLNENKCKAELIHFLGKFDFSELENKNISLTIDEHQSLHGQFVKLKKPLAILRIDHLIDPHQEIRTKCDHDPINVPLLDVIEFKVVFTSRPEPIVYIT